MNRQHTSLDIRNFILNNLEQHSSDIIPLVASTFEITRQSAHEQLQKLIEEGMVASKGVTRNKTYFFRILIDKGFPPTVSIDTDNRSENEGWLNISKNIFADNRSHVLTVVGYGEDINPKNLCQEKYLLVRDSLGKKLIHYKVPAKNLLAHLLGIYKITGVKDVTDEGWLSRTMRLKLAR